MRRRRDLTAQQFKDYWLKNHAKLEERVIAESPVQRIVATYIGSSHMAR